MFMFVLPIALFWLFQEAETNPETIVANLDWPALLTVIVAAVVGIGGLYFRSRQIELQEDLNKQALKQETDLKQTKAEAQQAKVKADIAKTEIDETRAILEGRRQMTETLLKRIEILEARIEKLTERNLQLEIDKVKLEAIPRCNHE